MLETPEQIQCTLNLAGEEITFLELKDNNDVVIRESFTLKAIPGQIVFNVQDYSSPADLSTREIQFRCSREDYIAKAITLEDLFTYVPSISPSRVSTFRIVASYDDLTGWICMIVVLTEVEDVI